MHFEASPHKTLGRQKPLSSVLSSPLLVMQAMILLHAFRNPLEYMPDREITSQHTKQWSTPERPSASDCAHAKEYLRLKMQHCRHNTQSAERLRKDRSAHSD